jgi:hypothetical protein
MRNASGVAVASSLVQGRRGEDEGELTQLNAGTAVQFLFSLALDVMSLKQCHLWMKHPARHIGYVLLTHAREDLSPFTAIQCN